MLKMRHLFMVPLAVAILSVDCVKPRKSTDSLRSYKSINRFGNQLLKKLVNNEKFSNENILFSPVSIEIAISSILLGCENETRREIENGLQLNHLNNPHESFKTLLNDLKNDDKKDGDNKVEVSISSQMIVRDGFKIKDDYIRKIEDFYNFYYNQNSFAEHGEDVKLAVNARVKEETRGEIKEILTEAPDDSAVMILMNSVFFKGNWLKQFDKSLTTKQPFFNYGDKERKTEVPTMLMKTHTNYYDDKVHQFKSLELNYTNTDFSMILIVPHKLDGINQLIDLINDELIEKIIKSFRSREVSIEMPRVKVESSIDLKPFLNELGIKKLFGSNADLRGITESHGLFVSDTLHKATIKIDEEGTIAAAATAVVAVSRIAMSNFQYFTVDRPFIFIIRHKPSGTNLFIGRINHL